MDLNLVPFRSPEEVLILLTQYWPIPFMSSQKLVSLAEVH